MQFIRISSEEPVVSYLVKTLVEHLRAGERVLWLLSGGSAIKVELEVARELLGMPLELLSVSLIDERYGPVSHADSNWQQLEAAGFDLPGATLLPVLVGLGRDATVAKWGSSMDELLTSAQYRLGFFGIGPDGHTSGILPNSLAVAATGVDFSYDGGGYQRITTTFTTILRLDEAVVYAVGEAKWPVLDRLNQNVALADQPAQVLKQLDKLTVFTDQPAD